MTPMESPSIPPASIGEFDSAATVSGRIAGLTRASATRRAVLKGAAATGVTAATGGIVADIVFAGPASAATSDEGGGSAGHQVVAHVRDVRSGEIDVYVGSRQVTVHDTALAARIARAGR